MNRLIIIVLLIVVLVAVDVEVTGPVKVYNLTQLNNEVLTNVSLTNLGFSGVSYNMPSSFVFSFSGVPTNTQTNEIYLSLSNHVTNLITFDTVWPLSVSGSDGWTPIVSIGIFYILTSGQWRMKFFLYGTNNGNDDPTVIISNVVFSAAIPRQPVIPISYDATFANKGWATGGTNIIQLYAIGDLLNASSVWSILGEVALNGKPAYFP